MFFQTPNADIEYKIDHTNVAARKFFAVNKQNGEMSIVQPLTNDKDLTETYTVSMKIYTYHTTITLV